MKHSEPSPRRHFHGPDSPHLFNRLWLSDFCTSDSQRRFVAKRPMKLSRSYRQSFRATSLASTSRAVSVSEIHWGSGLDLLNIGLAPGGRAMLMLGGFHQLWARQKTTKQ